MVAVPEEIGGAMGVASLDLGMGAALDKASRLRVLEVGGAVGVVSSELRMRRGISSAVEAKVRAYVEFSC